jgi:hypothetical protein
VKREVVKRGYTAHVVAKSLYEKQKYSEAKAYFQQVKELGADGSRKRIVCKTN